jgi:hypothetical protein
LVVYYSKRLPQKIVLALQQTMCAGHVPLLGKNRDGGRSNPCHQPLAAVPTPMLDKIMEQDTKDERAGTLHEQSA